MKLSEQLKHDHESGDFGNALAGYAERAALLESAVVSMAEDGWLYHGVEGMSEPQAKCYAAYLDVVPPNVPIEGRDALSASRSNAELGGTEDA